MNVRCRFSFSAKRETTLIYLYLAASIQHLYCEDWME